MWELVVTGWKHRNHRILWRGVGTGGTDKWVDETVMWVAVLY